MRFMWSEGLRGLLVGAPLGALIGLSACVWMIEGTWLFPGDTILIGAMGCGVAGFLWGESFFEWLSDWWHRFL